MKKESKKNAVNNKPSRRSFLSKAWLFLGGVAVLETAWVVADFFKARQAASEVSDKNSLFVAGSIDRFERGSVTAFQEGKFYLACLKDGGYLAFSRKCTHLGCTVSWDKEKEHFVCPCHASSFDIHGSVQSPPAPRPLDLFPVRIENNTIKVDLKSQYKRKEFLEDQVVRS